MNEQHTPQRGSAWAALDESFFTLVQDCFSHAFCAGSTAMLASYDDPDVDVAAAPFEQVPLVIVLPMQDDAEAAARRAAMRRHPSSRRRF